jgi:hypothetical protein
MTYAGNLSVEASLTAGPEAAARIPLEVVDYIRSRHSLATQTERGVHIRIPDRMLAAPVDVQGDIEERTREFLLLLELSSDEGLAHYFGEGVYQFWIRPDDLGAGPFRPRRAQHHRLLRASSALGKTLLMELVKRTKLVLFISCFAQKVIFGHRFDRHNLFLAVSITDSRKISGRA